MAKIASAYDYYVSTYGHKEVSRYDSHKKSDLRKIYNHMIKTNKESPLYKISDIDDAARFAIDIKEHAKALQNVVASLSDDYAGFGNSFQKKVAVSSDEDVVEATYVGDGSEESLADSFTIEVTHLATPQINESNELKKNELSLSPGTYSFDLNTTNASYEFQYSVNSDETNYDILNKLANLVNKSSFGIKAEVLFPTEDTCKLQLSSSNTGLAEGEEYLFHIEPSMAADSYRAMQTLGFHKVASKATNSEFLLNQTPHTALGNTFTINNTFELTLKDFTTDAPITIGFKSDVEAIADNVQSLLDTFNAAIASAEKNSEGENLQGRRLLSDLSSVSKNFRYRLDEIGLIIAENGSLSIDEDTFEKALSPDSIEGTFHTLTEFKNAIGAKADQASINPMAYVNKVVVAYKNPGRNFNTPYISSIYSGMICDRYA